MLINDMVVDMVYLKECKDFRLQNGILEKGDVLCHCYYCVSGHNSTLNSSVFERDHGGTLLAKLFSHYRG